jgi:Amt family ammonium transporter
MTQMTSQLIGSATGIIAAFGAGLILMYAVKALGVLRISAEDELDGIDIVEHGAPAYHNEPAYEGYSAIPSGKSPKPVGSPTGIPTSISVGD